MPETTIVLREVAISFGSGSRAVHAVRNASARFEAGQMSLIIGPAQSGKTTLLSVIGCLLKPDRGEVLFGDCDITRLEQAQMAQVHRDSVGFVFQEFRLFQSLSAVENVMIGLGLSGQGGPAYGTAMTLLESLGMIHKSHARSSKLSGSERQRVALARALANNPAVLIADEPTDAGILRDLSERGDRVVIAATHDLALIPYAHRVLTMMDGVLEEGRPQ